MKPPPCVCEPKPTANQPHSPACRFQQITRMKPTPCVVKHCHQPATLTHPTWGKACTNHAPELDKWGDGWETIERKEDGK